MCKCTHTHAHTLRGGQGTACRSQPSPSIVFWGLNHFVQLDGKCFTHWAHRSLHHVVISLCQEPNCPWIKTISIIFNLILFALFSSRIVRTPRMILDQGGASRHTCCLWIRFCIDLVFYLYFRSRIQTPFISFMSILFFQSLIFSFQGCSFHACVRERWAAEKE